VDHTHTSVERLVLWVQLQDGLAEHGAVSGGDLRGPDQREGLPLLRGGDDVTEGGLEEEKEQEYDDDDAIQCSKYKSFLKHCH